MTKYEIIFETLQDKVNSGELTIEEAEVLNDLAYEKYVTEDGHSKKLKARHNAKKKHIEQRFYDNMNYEHDYTDKYGTKHGTVKRGDGPVTEIEIPKKGLDAHLNKDFGYIRIGRNVTRMKGSDLTGSHEYSHSIDYDNMHDQLRDEFMEYNKKYLDYCDQKRNGTKRDIKKALKSKDKSHKKYLKKYDKLTKDNNGDFNNFSKEVNKKIKITNEHDKKPHELKADNYSYLTTHGHNNTNRDKKHLKELERRTIQSSLYTHKDNMKYIKDKIDHEIGHNVVGKGLHSLVNYTDRKFKKKLDKNSKSYISDVEKRKNAADYIIDQQNKKKENS